jgi:hypothetical protein
MLAGYICLSWLIETGPAAAEEMRVLNFPPNESYGQINVLNKGWLPAGIGKDITSETYIARGPVKVARSKTLALVGSFALGEHLDVLKNLPADAFGRLDLDKLSVQSSDLANISHMTGLRNLDLDSTDINDTGLKYIKPLTNLQYLSISRTMLKGKTLGELTALTKLERLHLSHCDLDLSNLNLVSKLKTLRSLHLSSSQLTDASLQFLTPLTNLEELDLAGNNAITDYGVRKLACLKSLHHIDLADSKVSEAGILALKGLPLVSIKLGDTRVTAASQRKLTMAFPKCLIEYAKSHQTPVDVFGPLH